jgi:hypothetical protein
MSNNSTKLTSGIRGLCPNGDRCCIADSTKIMKLTHMTIASDIRDKITIKLKVMAINSTEDINKCKNVWR